MARILVVDDEAPVVNLLVRGLGAEGHEVIVARSGEDALDAAARDPPDVMLVDLGLPDIDGKDVVRRLRSFSAAAILVLSGRNAESEKVEALDAGADDYVTKPFGMRELLARLRAILRRPEPDATVAATLRYGTVEVDLRRRVLRRSGDPVHLTPTEFALLEALATHPGKLLTHRWLLARIWGSGYGDETNYLRVYVGQLREKLGDDAASPSFIETEPRVGYRWIPDPDPVAEP